MRKVFCVRTRWLDNVSDLVDSEDLKKYNMQCVEVT